MTVAVELEGVEHAYDGGDFQLAISELRLAPGERVALVGPSGSGKTTLLHLLSGCLRPRRGRVAIGARTHAERDEAELRRWRSSEVGLVFQDLELLPYLSGLENILLPLRLAGGPVVSTARERAQALARDFGVEHTLRRKPSRLSGGERQRLALARALVGRPSLLLLDEPTGHLDRANARRACDRLWAAADELGATLVMVTHDDELAARCPTTIDAGRGFGCRREADE
ncbi:MAG: ATP-binding cassette domain-containing protein [Planctomycetota bacterium]